MKNKYLLVAIATATVLVSCKKDKIVMPPVTPPPASDVQSVRLKDIVISNLPSPYYHFEYNDSGYITKTSFAAGLRTYDINYGAKLIREIKSTHIINKDRLIYEYENGRPFLVKYLNEGGEVYKRSFITYNNSGQPQKIEWDLKLGNTGFALMRTLGFTYYADENIKELKDQRHAINGVQDEALYIDRFEDYEDKLNVDGFTLLHNEHDHLLLFPRVKLQKKNPLKQIRTGTGVSYLINYTYTYNDQGKPVLKQGDFVFTSGPNAGQHFQTSASFTYYP